MASGTVGRPMMPLFSSALLFSRPARISPAAMVRSYGTAPPPLKMSRRVEQIQDRNRRRVLIPPTPAESIDTTTRQAAKDDMYDDIGLIPETFVMPTGIDRPSIRQQPKLRLTMEWHRVKSKILMVVRALFIKYFQTKGMMPPYKLDYLKLSTIGLNLYKQMNASFSSGDKTKLASSVTTGFLDVLDSKLSRRGNQTLEWQFTGKPSARLIVDTITKLPYRGPTSPLPGENIHLMRQAIIRIDGEQSVRQGVADSSTGVVSWDRMPVRNRQHEYVVMQQTTLHGKVKPWKIWGTTRETTVNEFLDMRKRQGHRSEIETSKATDGLM